MDQTLAQATAERLYAALVAEKRYGPGEKLPNELELSRQLGVSRATLREAIRTLAEREVLEVRRGRGTYVSPRVEEREDFGLASLEGVRARLRDLFEVREIFEPRAAALACARATEEELREILALGRAVEEQIRAGADRTRTDGDFHAAIVRATHNAFLMRLLPLIAQAVETAIAAGGHHRQRLTADTLRDHALLLEFLAQRDAAGAEHAMAIHMRHAMGEMGLQEARS